MGTGTSSAQSVSRRPVACAVMLAAGEGTRIRPISDALPKAALPVGNRPLILHHLDALLGEGIEDIVIVIGASGEVLRKIVDAEAGSHRARIRYVHQSERRGIAHALACAESVLSSPFVLILADVSMADHRLSVALSEYHSHACAAILGAKRESDPTLMRRNFSIALDPNGDVTRVIEKPTDPAPGLKGVGTYVFDDRIFNAIRRTPPSALRGEQEITDAIQTLIDSGARVRPAIVTANDVNVNDITGLIGANTAFLTARGLCAMIAADASVDPTAVVEHSIVAPGARIGPGVRLDECVVLSGAIVIDRGPHHRCVFAAEGPIHAEGAQEASRG